MKVFFKVLSLYKIATVEDKNQPMLPEEQSLWALC